jgi:phosphoesterase RecJ-like protein
MNNFSKLSKQIFDLIRESDHILLSLHPSPDGDSVGSSLAMYHYLTTLGKDVQLIKGDSELPTYLKKLPGYDQITLKNYFELDLNSFDLFIILDSSALNQISKINQVTFPKNLKTIIIDHHSTNEHFGDINLVDNDSPATAQIITQLILDWKVAITPAMAINLFTGIYMDTGGFKYPKTTDVTFSLTSTLAKLNPDFPQYIFDFENNDEPNRIIFKGLALSSIEHYFGNKVALSAISYQRLKRYHLKKQDTEKGEISNILKAVVGWDIGISLVETEPGVCIISLRTRDSQTYDLSLIAKTVGTGGGHRAAAGSNIYKSYSQAKKHLIKTIGKLYPDLGNP